MQRSAAPFSAVANILFIENYSVLLDRPKINERTKRTKKIKNRTLAIPAAPAAIPPKPNMAAMMATIKKITVQRNIT